ncbi:MAG: biotin carboxylase N-terminal domain-containing protein [Burkholderiales bacterium]|nr:biotin carboxylase N-terminal domain-containing protein [Burkholderiales bacterium]
MGGSSPAESYLNIAAILQAEGEAVHPGYGFLSENAAFAEAVERAGRIWVGPPPAAIRAMGDKANAKALAKAAGVPVLPTWRPESPDLRFPVMIKAAAGGGGRGMRLVRDRSELAAALASARSEAEHAFGDGRLLLEPAIERARHVEVQVFADRHGDCIHLGERDCSVQRRHQKLVEESPSPAVDARLRERMGAAAVAVARAAGYVGAGTVEFLLDEDGRFWFMEMNTRLQVEHPVTEAVTGLDLVEWQLRIAAGEPLPLAQDAVRFSGHAIEARLCAEDPARDFLPQTGRIALWEPAAGVRVDHALETGAIVSPHYDSMLAKLVVHAPTRDAARERLARALEDTVCLGLATNKAFLAAVLRDPAFAAGGATTDFLSRFRAPPEPGADAARAIAAALRAAAAGHGEWNSWSNNPARAMRLRPGGVDVSLERDPGGFAATVGERRFRVALALDSRHRARVRLNDGAEEAIAFALDGGTVHLAWRGASFSFEDTLHAPPERRGVGFDGTALASPMNARVVAVHARAGDAVEAGAALVVLEAMKMEHVLAAPAAVRVKAVHVERGAQVSPGQLLVEFEREAVR